MRLPSLVCLLAVPAMAAPVIETDICVYGGTSGGVIAAVQAARQGKSVALAVFGNHVGGLTSGGLGATDVGSNGNTYIQGLSREFYHRIATAYNVAGPKFTFEPKVAEATFNTMLSEVAVTPRYQQRLASVSKAGQRITEITMEDGTRYRAKMFIDSSYEGDLLAMAGVTYTLGRESVATYGESLNGIRASTPSHQFTVNVDPYVIPGNPASGLLPFIQPGNGGTPGEGDARIQAYNYRLCLTNVAANRIPITAPSGYNESTYELLGRLIDARVNAGQTLTLGSFMNVSGMPNGKTDINNNGAFSTDFIGMSDAYPTATYAQRAVIDQQHRDYIQGFLYYLGHSLRVPAAVRNSMLSYGWCADEFTDNGGWGQLYVREARRMVSDYVMLQQNCQGTRVASDPIGLGSYTMDSHNCQRIVQGGFVRNEGDVQSSSIVYGISYRSLIPKVGECENLLVPWALSSSHLGFGSIRMEPVHMIMGQSAATAAALAIDTGVPVQQLSYPKLALQLTVDGQALSSNSATAGGIIVDNADSTGVAVTGTWVTSSSTPGFQGTNYLHDDMADKGNKSVRFTPNIPATGQYDVYLRWTAHANRSTNIPVDVNHAGGTNTFTVDQTVTANGGVWNLLQRATFNEGTAGSVLMRTTGTAAGTYVVADAARFVPVITPLPSVQVIASDTVAREGTVDQARFTLVRPVADSASALTVHYTLGGTAQNGVDYTALPGSVTMAAGVASVTIPVQAIGDTLAEGTENVVLTIQPNASYTIGALASDTVQVLDRPVDAWRAQHFTSEELAQPNLSGDLADFDHDGLANIAEYALALDPKHPDEITVTTNPAGDGYLSLTYSRRKSATDAAITVQASHDMKDWVTPVAVQQTALVDEGETERVTVRLASPISQFTSGFLRLRVTR